jgi:gliding motility-associated lipoprotein GldH
MKFKIILSLFLAVTFFGCNNNVIFSEYRMISDAGWNKDTVFSFDVEISDTVSSYEIDFLVRNTDNFPRQNLWLNVVKIKDDNVFTDTVNIYLSDDYGKWRGKGIGSYFDNEIIYKQNVKFYKSGKYTYKLLHIMRTENLVGLKYVGLQIAKSK